jgi:hypothetical protein
MLTAILNVICTGFKAITTLFPKSDLEKAIRISKKKSESESIDIHNGTDIDKINFIFKD